MSEGAARPTVVDPDETDLLPRQVYLACRPDEDTGGLMLEIRESRGQQVVPAYSSLDHFLDGCGPDQPWVLIPSDRLVDFAREAPGSGSPTAKFRFGVMVDTSLPPEQRGTAGGMAENEARWDEDQSEDWTLVHVACRSFPQGHVEQARPELQPMPGERLAMMTYTSPAALEAGCGPYQASVPIPAGVLGEARRESGAHTICLDTPLPQHLRHGPGERN